MSSFDKVVKLACKPKAAPPKAKYLDPIIAATWSEDGAVHDVCKALTPRFREPNAIVVFKALIVLHTMIRNGATDNVLSYLSSSEVLRLRNVSAGNWEGYHAPQNLQHYAIYLDSRIRAYRDLKHDVVRVQSESNRDMRNSTAIEEDSHRNSTRAPTRSKTISGRKLRVMTVEKGLLRETKTVQKTIDSLVECRFYLDDLEDELTITALRMLVKDLLILFQAGNEGVINVLEHYFEMSHIDAEQALAIYRHFCKQTEKVVEYLGVAKKLQNLLNVPIPNLKHAPVSLAGALQEYLNDPNFEQNRIEYRTNKEAAEKNGISAPPKKSEAASKPEPSTSTAPTTPTSAPVPEKKPDPTQAMVDFFSAIEEEQPTMFNPQTGSPTANYFQQQAAHNPFVQRQMTGLPFNSQPFSLQPQPTGFPMPQQPFFQPPQQSPNPFGLQQQQHQPFSSFLQPQATGFLQPQTTFLRPQTTGANPFRQSMLLPQSTGMLPFAASNPNGPIANPGPFQGLSASGPLPAAPFSAAPNFAGPFAQPSSPNTVVPPPRPASTPLKSSSSPPPMQPVKSHQTGSRNPFGVPVTPVPPMPKPPTLMELAMGANPGANGNMNGMQPFGNGSQPQQQSTTDISTTFGGSGNSSQDQGANMASVASAFAFSNPNESTTATTSSFLNPQYTSTTMTSSANSDSLFSSLSSQPTGTTNVAFSSAAAPSISVSGPLQSQPTGGFSGLKPFKPTSSFGASLLESLPPIPGSSPNTPAATGDGSTSVGGPLLQQRTGLGALGNNKPGSGLPPMGSSSTVGVGLRPQMTGVTANPFRATMFATSPSSTGSGLFTSSSGGSQFSPSSSTNGSAFGGGLQLSTGAPFGPNLFGSQFSPVGQQDGSKPQQPSSLI